MLRRLRIQYRIWMINLLAVIGMLVILLVAVNRQYEQMDNLKRQELSHLIDVAEGILDDYRKRAARGEFSREEAQFEALRRISAMSYGGKGASQREYLWIHDTQMNMLAHPSANLRGKNLADLKDTKGKPFFRLFTEQALAEGETFLYYHWERPGEDEPQPKLSYVRYYPEWGWMLGTGIYVDDINRQFIAGLKELSFLSIFVLLLQLGLAVVIARSITKPLGATTDALANISKGEGDLTVRLPEKGQDEVSEVSRHFNHFVEKIQELVAEVSTSVRSVASASEELTRISEQGYTTQQQQTRETDQVATAINEMSASFHEVARNAGEASDAANQMDQAALAGSDSAAEASQAIGHLAEQVQRSTRVIHKLNQDTDTIGTVLDVINGVAEQTNLLALNAAIEAARAGEAGRGFAVVADEVRSLASRTQESTQEIHKMISTLREGAGQAVATMDASLEETEATVAATEKAGGALDSIAAQVERIRDMNQQIATASEQQAAVVEEVDRNLANLVGLCEESSKATEHTQTASSSLADLSEQLQRLVGQFKV